MKRLFKSICTSISAALLAGCGADQSQWPGTVEWDRAAVLAEISEPVIAVEVGEGQHVGAGQILLRLDPRRTDADLAALAANLQQQDAQLDELRHGARKETIDAARAQLERAQSEAANAQRESERAQTLHLNQHMSQQDADRARTAAKTSRASADAASAQLLELLHGTRPEQLAQAEAAREIAAANLQRLQLVRQRLDVRAPREGRIDALPYRLGDQPPLGATLVSLLVGARPYARIYVPEQQRNTLTTAQHFRVHVDGVTQPFEATLRAVRSDPIFTPYYALSGDDASRLVYRAELFLAGDGAAALAPGVPCHAEQTEAKPH